MVVVGGSMWLKRRFASTAAGVPFALSPLLRSVVESEEVNGSGLSLCIAKLAFSKQGHERG
jgi:hypothetical protein